MTIIKFETHLMPCEVLYLCPHLKVCVRRRVDLSRFDEFRNLYNAQNHIMSRHFDHFESHNFRRGQMSLHLMCHSEKHIRI